MPELLCWNNAAISYRPALEQLKKHEVPETYPVAAGYPYLCGEYSIDEGSCFVRDEVVRLVGYYFLAYNWIRPLSNWIGCRLSYPRRFNAFPVATSRLR